MSGRTGAWTLTLGAVVVVGGCSGGARAVVATSSGTTAQTSTGAGTSTSGTGGSGTGGSSTGGAGTGGTATGGAGTGGTATGTGLGCASPGDQSILAQHHGDILINEAVCNNSPSDMVTCLQSSLGLSEACAACYANGWSCLLSGWGAACDIDPHTQPCAACFATTCLPAQAACTGPIPH